MLKNKTYIIAQLALLISLAACQKVIDIDLNSADPQIVVEAYINDQAEPCSVKISQTVNFSEANDFPPLSNAEVILKDDLGNAETLTETSPGLYTSSLMFGTPGRKYFLEIKNNDKTYQAESYLARPVEIDSIVIAKSLFGNNKTVQSYFHDPSGEKNYYRIIRTFRGERQNSFTILNDNLRDGQQIMINQNLQTDKLIPGDTILVELQSIDFNAFEFYRTFNQANRRGPTATPANPENNFTNGALGIFSAYATRSKMIVVEE
jgi:hypothetical protein